MKTPNRTILGIFLLAWLAFFTTATQAKHHHKGHGSGGQTAETGTSPTVGENTGNTATSGKFDYYLLSLSWSPEFCLSKGASAPPEQCGSKRFGFVVHGLWPQFEQGYPQNCDPNPQPVPDAVATTVLPIMPSHDLIKHEWEKHGTCSGLTVNEYFSTIEKAFSSVNVPTELKNPQTAININPNALTESFLKENPSFPKNSTVVLCKSRQLTEVHICMGKALKPRACAADVLKDQCKTPTIVAPPVK